MSRKLIAALVLLPAAACAGASPAPPPECAAAWADSDAGAFVDELVAATAARTPVWPGYDLGDPTTVIYAGDTDSGEACLGAWRAGRAVAYGALPDAPEVSATLYGYYLPAANRAAGAEGGPRGEQPASIRDWLEDAGVERATILPVTVEDFPIALPALVKAQVAIHEGFHVEVQSPTWIGEAVDNWPAWDHQPDRPGMGVCYGGTSGVESSFEEERETLARTVEALLDGDRAAACDTGRRFLDLREARYAMLADVSVARYDSTPGTCREAEAIMELEEGTADYASWTMLYDLGLATRDQLMRRYRALQNDVFYLTGAMQLHAIQLMDPDGMMGIAEGIAASASPETGSITVVFRGSLEDYCGG